jgi:hypothetical protein
LAGAVVSIFLGQQNRGGAAVRFRDDPDFGSAVKGLSREKPKPANETEFVLAAVVLVYVSPVPGDVPGEIPERSLARCLQRCEGTGRGYNPTGLELLLSHG